MSRSLACFLFVCLFFFYESHPFIAQNITQISKSYKCPAPFSLIYRSIFIATIRLIIVTLSFARQRDFLWPESRPIIAQNFAQKSEPKKCLARFSLIYRSIFVAPVRLVIVTLSIAHQRDYLWPKSRPCLAQNFRTGRIASNPTGLASVTTSVGAFLS